MVVVFPIQIFFTIVFWQVFLLFYSTNFEFLSGMLLPQNLNGSSSFCKGPRTSKVWKSKNLKNFALVSHFYHILYANASGKNKTKHLPMDSIGHSHNSAFLSWCWWILEADPLVGGCLLMNYRGGPKEGCNWGHVLSAAIKLGTPEPKFLQSGLKLTCSQ